MVTLLTVFDLLLENKYMTYWSSSPPAGNPDLLRPGPFPSGRGRRQHSHLHGSSPGNPHPVSPHLCSHHLHPHHLHLPQQHARIPEAAHLHLKPPAAERHRLPAAQILTQWRGVGGGLHGWRGAAERQRSVVSMRFYIQVNTLFKVSGRTWASRGRLETTSKRCLRQRAWDQIWRHWKRLEQCDLSPVCKSNIYLRPAEPAGERGVAVKTIL